MPVYYLALFFLFLLLVAGYMFLSHSIEKRRIRHQRLVTALRARRNAFKDLATSFPKGFLSQDLLNLLYRSLIDCCEQLTRLEPRDSSHAEQLAFYTGLLNAQQTQDAARVRLENHEQIKEARRLLQELHKFIVQQAALKLISSVQSEAYVDQIKRLVLQITVDGHVINARQSQQIGKIRLAIHYYGLARKLLMGENVTRAFDKQIAQLTAVIAKLEEKAKPSDTSEEAPSEKGSDPETDKEWNRFTEESEGWKKKQIYD